MKQTARRAAPGSSPASTRPTVGFNVLGLSWITPVLRAAAGDNPSAQGKEIWRLLGVPLIAILRRFLLLWGTLAPHSAIPP